MTYTVSHRFCCKHHQDLSRTPTQCTFQSFAKYIILDNFGYDTHELACGMAELELFWGWTRSLSLSRERERGRANYTKVVAMNSSSKSVRSRQKKTNLKYCILNVPRQSAQDRNGKTTPDYHSLWANNPQMICTPLAMSDMLIGAEKGVRRCAVQIRGKFVKAWSRCETPTAKSKTDTTTLLRLPKTSTHLGYTTAQPTFSIPHLHHLQLLLVSQYLSAYLTYLFFHITAPPGTPRWQLVLPIRCERSWMRPHQPGLLYACWMHPLKRRNFGSIESAQKGASCWGSLEGPRGVFQWVKSTPVFQWVKKHPVFQWVKATHKNQAWRGKWPFFKR